MPREVKLSIPHHLGAEEATRRIREGLDRLRADYGSYLSEAHADWRENHADVGIGAFGQHVNGTIEVMPDQVEVTVLLPVLLAGFAERARTFLESKGADMLCLPPGTHS